MLIRRLFVTSLWSCWILELSAWETCPGTNAICPNSNLCCNSDSGGRHGRGQQGDGDDSRGTTLGDGLCLSGNRGSAAYSTCCPDSEEKGTGCGQGFVCATQVDVNKHNDSRLPICLATNPYEDELPVMVPRNKLCHVTPNMTYSFGLPMPQSATSTSTRRRRRRHRPVNDGTPVAAYLSTHGAIHESNSNVIFEAVTQAIVLVHGSSRNVDDYICCTSAAIPTNKSSWSSSSSTESVLIVAPWFLAPFDGPVNLTATSSQQHERLVPLRWMDMPLTDDDVPQEHTWRFGAESISSDDDNHASYSSFTVVDQLVQHLMDRRMFPHVQQIVVTGHSAGGQVVQRWALLTSVIPSRTTATTAVVPIRTVVANPKSYAYLDARRWVPAAAAAGAAVTENQAIKDDERLVFDIPPSSMIDACPTYNEWLWGLDRSTLLQVPYFDAALAAVHGNVEAMRERFAMRNVLYLSGDQDVLHNGDCEANVQGPNRFIRSERYFAALQEIFQYNNSSANTDVVAPRAHQHQRWVVPNVHHDHCLMYQSQQGQLALFSGPELDRDAHEKANLATS